MTSVKKNSSKGKTGSPRTSGKTAPLKDLAANRRAGSVQGGKRSSVKDSNDKYA